MTSRSSTARDGVRRLRPRSGIASADLQLARMTSVELPIAASVAETPVARIGLRLRNLLGLAPVGDFDPGRN